MQLITLPVFSPGQFKLAHHYLATRVTDMMGRKLEEEDWARVYCASKGIPRAGWSNTDIDVMFGHVGVEHKMICSRSKGSIRDACGTTIMHPAGTRQIRIPTETDPTKAARIILAQYGALIERRKALVRTLDQYNNGLLDRAQAIAKLRVEIGYNASGASDRVPTIPIPSPHGFREPELRTGWLLWQDSLREFLYFEEPMTPPDPSDYWGEWRDRAGSGSRQASRNLWIYHRERKEKHFSITTDAGPKVQPYFKVPVVDDPNLYYFVVQAEDYGSGLTRVWVSQITASLLVRKLGDTTPETLARAIDSMRFESLDRPSQEPSIGPLAVPLLVPTQAYERIRSELKGVSDEHNFKQFVELLDPITFSVA